MKRTATIFIGAVVILLITLFYPTIFGTIRLKAPWKEDAFVGRTVNSLQVTGISLVPLDAETYFAMTGCELGAAEKALKFKKGPEYRWYVLGSAINLGYVAVNTNSGTIVKMHHVRNVDSL